MEAAAATGAARRARDRKQRSTSRKVAWLAHLLQASSGHHTGFEASQPALLMLELQALRQEVAELRRLVCGGGGQGERCAHKSVQADRAHGGLPAQSASGTVSVTGAGTIKKEENYEEQAKVANTQHNMGSAGGGGAADSVKQEIAADKESLPDDLPTPWGWLDHPPDLSAIMEHEDTSETEAANAVGEAVSEQDYCNDNERQQGSADEGADADDHDDGHTDELTVQGADCEAAELPSHGAVAKGSGMLSRPLTIAEIELRIDRLMQQEELTAAQERYLADLLRLEDRLILQHDVNRGGD